MLILTPDLNRISRIFTNAEEIWIATALMNIKALNVILDKTRKICKKNFLIGTWLPTDYESLYKLFNLSEPGLLEVKIFSSAGFHPKIYIAKKRNSYVAVLGSSNCTMGGFLNNIEANVIIKNRNVVLELIQWYDIQAKDGRNISDEFLKIYKKIAQARKKRLNQSKKEQNKLNKIVEANEAETIHFRKVFLNRLKKWRRTKRYLEEVKDRKIIITKLRRSLNYPNFDNHNFNEFFKIRELGSILGFSRFDINYNKSKFRKILFFLKRKDISVIEKINNTCYNDEKYNMFGVKKGIITKVLTIINPQKYFVWNTATDTALKRYGLYFRRGMSQGEKYKLMCDTLINICKKTKIKDLSVLDKFLYDYFKKRDKKG